MMLIPMEQMPGFMVPVSSEICYPGVGRLGRLRGGDLEKVGFWRFWI